MMNPLLNPRLRTSLVESKRESTNVRRDGERPKGPGSAFQIWYTIVSHRRTAFSLVDYDDVDGHFKYRHQFRSSRRLARFARVNRAPVIPA